MRQLLDGSILCGGKRERKNVHFLLIDGIRMVTSWAEVALSQIERPLTNQDLVDDDGERVDVPFGRSFRRRRLGSQQFRRSPQFAFIIVLIDKKNKEEKEEELYVSSRCKSPGRPCPLRRTGGSGAQSR